MAIAVVGSRKLTSSVARYRDSEIVPMPSQSFDRAVSETVLNQILHDPLLLQQLGDRVYELLQEDLRKQSERSRGYGRRF
jgi:hypothetical protein